MLNGKLKTISKGLGYILYTLSLFIVCAYYMFPYDALKDNLTRKAGQTIGKPISIQKIFPAFFPAFIGVGINNIAIKDSHEENAVTIFSANNILARIGFKSIFSSQKIINFRIDAYGGDISGNIDFHKDKIRVHTQFNGIKTDEYPLKELKIMTNPVIMDLTGNGEMDILASGNKISEGNISLNIQKGVIDTFKIYNFELPLINYNTISSKIHFKDRKVDVRKFNIKGKDVEMTLDGDIVLQNIPSASSIRLNLKFKISQAYMKKAGIPAGIIKAGKKDSKGFSNIRVTGTLGKPAVRF